MGIRLFTCFGYLSLVQPKPQMSQRSSGTDVPWAQHVLSSLCQWGRRLRCGLPVGPLRGQSLSCSILIEGAGAPSVWPLPIPPQRPVATLNTGRH